MNIAARWVAAATAVLVVSAGAVLLGPSAAQALSLSSYCTYTSNGTIDYYDCTPNISRLPLTGVDLTALASGTDLERADFSGADLDGSDLHGLDLNQATFNSGGPASMIGTDLHGANLGYAFLNGVDLTNADFHGAYLFQANLQHATLVDANFSGLSDGTYAYFDSVNADGANFTSSDLTASTFSNAILTNTKLLSATLVQTYLMATLTGSDLIPSPAAAVSTDGNPVAVTFAIPQNADLPAPTTCNHASGSMFPVGTTTVSCTVHSTHDYGLGLVNTTGTGAFVVTVYSGAIVTTDTVGPFSVGAAGSGSFAASGDGTLAWSLLAGSLPAGLTLSVGGTISGTPSAGTAGAYAIQVRIIQALPAPIGSHTVDFAATVTVNPEVDLLIDGVQAAGSTQQAGSNVTLSVSGLVPGTTVDAVLNSTPFPLGSATVGAGGVFSLATTIPASVPAGSHSITLTVTPPGGVPFTTTTALTISAARALAATGVDARGAAIPGLALLVGGLMIIGIRQLRRRRAL